MCILFLKGSPTLAKAIPQGARWITVHPNGADSPGQPVMIQDNPDGSAHVIGGAGGKLNYLKLRGVKKASEYAKEAEGKKKAKAEEAKAQRQRDKEAGLVESKKKARDAVRAQEVAHQSSFVRKVASTMGWDPQQLEFPEQDVEKLSESAQKKARDKFHRDLLKKALDAVDTQRQRLVSDANARIDAGISEVPLHAKDPDTLSVQDIAPIPENPAGLGFSTDYKKRAEVQGLTQDELKQETSSIKADKQRDLSDGQKAGIVKRTELAKKVRQELEGLRDPLPDLKTDLVDAKKAVELLKAHKQLKDIHRQAAKQRKAIDKSDVEPKAYVLEAKDDVSLDDKVESDIHNDLRTVQTQAFLSEFGKLAGPNGEASLGKHLGVGAYNSINSLALAAGGEALVDRSVVDVLGIAGAAQVLARRLHADLEPHEVERIADGMQNFHLNHYMSASEDAMNRARELLSAAKEIELGEAANGHDLQIAQELNAKRRHAISDAQKVLGQALGEMEANAALVVALKQGRNGDFQVSLGKVTPESAVQQARAIGLQRGDYQIAHAGGDAIMTVTSTGMERLAKPVAREDLNQIQRNIDIISGRHDEEGWLPKGVANRPDLVMTVPAGVAPRLAQPFQPGDDLHQSLRDYIGGRAADGDSATDIVADIQSAAFFDKVGGRTDAYRQALDAAAPLKDQNGKLQRAEALESTFHSYADEFVDRHHGGKIAPLHRQKFTVDDRAVDALHRALSDTPEGTAAYKQLGDLTPDDQRALREYFHRNVAKESPEAGELRRTLESHTQAEPEKETEDMFGEKATNPEWSEWSQKRDELSGKVNAASLDWSKYTDAMHGHEKAYEAMQDLVRSNVSKGFAEHYNRANPKAAIKTGKTTIRNNLNHLDAVDPNSRQARMDKERELADGLRERSQGRYAAGGVADKLDAAREQQEAFNQSQMGFFSSEEMPSAPAEAPMGTDERHTIGHQAERQIAGMMGIVGRNFKPGQPTKLWAPSMSGGKNAARQRLIKMLDANKRVVAAFGTGSGKTLLQLAGFSHLHEQGKAKRGLFLVPSVVQGQFNGEALRYLQPGKYNWHIEPGASRDERIAAYKNSEKHFAVMTHAAFRDDMLHLGAQHAGIPQGEMADRLNAMTGDERKAWMKSIMDKEGINFDYLTVDEGQNTLNRSGKDNSALANVVDALSAHTPYYMTASADPVKNDASEIHDLLSKMDPDRYKDRAAFMRRYGADTLSAKDGLRREMARYVYPSRIDPDVHDDRKTDEYDLSSSQQKALAELDNHFANARMARMQGKVDIDAMKAISPESFESVATGEHEGVARELQKSLGIMKSAAINKVLYEHPDSPGIDRIADAARQRKGKPGVVFARSLKAVEMIRQRLERDGHRVAVITGADSGKDKERKRLQFNPESGDPEADILVASDAGSTGMNIQRGQWLYQHDTPMTAMTHAQRQGRIFRTGQKNDVELIDGVPRHPEAYRARDRLRKKYGLRELMSTPMEGLDDTGVAHFLKQRDVQRQQVLA